MSIPSSYAMEVNWIEVKYKKKKKTNVYNNDSIPYINFIVPYHGHTFTNAYIRTKRTHIHEYNWKIIKYTRISVHQLDTTTATQAEIFL